MVKASKVGQTFRGHLRLRAGSWKMVASFARTKLATCTPRKVDFSFEWKIAVGCNSGVKYRVTDYSGATLGPEYQIIDDAKGNYAPDHLGATASIYAIKGASAHKKLKPPGVFNLSSIVAKGRKLEHWLNGEKVAEIEIGSEDWKKRHGKSKFKARPGFGTKSGRIMLQEHGGQVRFRNLKLRKL